MKIRTGFVSNSSSSSFLVGIDPVCVTFDDFIVHGLYSYKKGELDLLIDDDDYIDKKMTYLDCIKQLWEDLLRLNHKADMNEWIDWINDGNIPECRFPFYDNKFIDAYTISHNIYYVYEDLYGEKLALKIQDKIKKLGDEWNSIVGEALIREMFMVFDGNLYEVIYADNDNSLSALMEHGDFWKFVPHLCISYH